MDNIINDKDGGGEGYGRREKKRLPNKIHIDFPFTKPFNIDGEAEVEDINYFAENDTQWRRFSPSSNLRCASAGSAGVDLFSAASSIGRARCLSTGSVSSSSRKSPRFHRECSPSSFLSSSRSHSTNQLKSPLSTVLEVTGESVSGCTSLSKKINTWNINDALSPPSVLLGDSMTDEEDSLLLPSFFSSSSVQNRLDRSSSFDEMQEAEEMDSHDIKILEKQEGVGNDELDTYPGHNELRNVIRPGCGKELDMKPSKSKLSFQESNMFSSLNSALPPSVFNRSDESESIVGQRPQKLPCTDRAVYSAIGPPRAPLVRATSLDFNATSPFRNAQYSPQSTLPPMTLPPTCSSVSKAESSNSSYTSNRDLSRRHTESSKFEIPQSPETSSMSGEGQSKVNSCGFNLFATPVGSSSCNISGQYDSSDWAMSDPSLTFELEKFEQLFRDGWAVS